MPAGQDETRLTLTAPQTPTEEPVDLCMEGRAMIEGREIVRQAVPAEDMMQAFIYHHLVPMQNLLVAVIGRERLRAPWKLARRSARETSPWAERRPSGFPCPAGR